MAVPTIYAGLNAIQAAFVTALAESGDLAGSYLKSGYQCDPANAENLARHALRSPNVTIALHSEVARLISSDGAIARSVAMEIMGDKAVNAKIRADLAIKLMHIAGHVAPKAGESIKSDKALSEMTLDELRTASESLQGEIADRSKPINSATPAPVPDEAIDFM